MQTFILIFCGASIILSLAKALSDNPYSKNDNSETSERYIRVINAFLLGTIFYYVWWH